MDTRWERRPPPLPSPQRARDYASFSASLLDAIYRSLDAADTETEPEPEPEPEPDQAPPPAEFWWAAAAGSRRAETPGPRPVRANRIRPAPPLPPPLPPPIETKSAAPKPRSIRSRLRELRKGRGSSSSSPLASLLKALFTSAGHVNKVKAPAPEPACSSALRRSAAAAAATPAKRSVRFHPAVSVVVGEDSRACGHERLRPAAEESMSDSSSDLFELENLTSSAGPRHEPPVSPRDDGGALCSLAARPAAIQTAQFRLL